MSKPTGQLIKDLAEAARPRPPLPRPWVRAACWSAAGLALTLAAAYWIQAFRPGFLQQVLGYPALAVEVLAALLLAPLGMWIAFALAVPGERIGHAPIAAAAALGTLLAAALALGFTEIAPAASSLGARPACWLEALAYGGLGMAAALLMLGRAYPRSSLRSGTLVGLAAGLPPAAIMQLACMYDPGHALHFHYGPIAALIPLAIGLSRLLNR